MYVRIEATAFARGSISEIRRGPCLAGQRSANPFPLSRRTPAKSDRTFKRTLEIRQTYAKEEQILLFVNIYIFTLKSNLNEKNMESMSKLKLTGFG